MPGPPDFQAIDRFITRDHLVTERPIEVDVAAEEIETALRGHPFLHHGIAGVLFQGVEDPWDGRPVLFGEPRQGRAPLERPMAPYLVAVLDIGRQRAATLRVPRRAGDDRTPAYHRETRVPACHWFADAGARHG